MSAFFRFAAETALAHADALNNPGGEPQAGSTALDTSPASAPRLGHGPASSPPGNLVRLDTRRKKRA